VSVFEQFKTSDIGKGLSAAERKAVLEELFIFGKDNQLPFLKRMGILLITSTIIACCGLLSDSAAVVIGAMLIAPMMRPVMSAAAAIALGWSHRLYQALLLAFVMAVCAVLISVLFAWLAPDMIEMPDQVIARTKPTFFDLVIALAAGSGGAYTITRKETSAIPGVAMAVALLPPLAATGILLVFNAPDLALKAFVLFFTNFSAMVLAGCIVFILVGVAPKPTQKYSSKFIRNYLLVFSLLVFGTAIPLYSYSNATWYDSPYQANQSVELQNWLRTNELTIDEVHIDKDNAIIYFQLIGPNPPINVQTLHSELAHYILKKHGKTPTFKVEVTWVKSVKYSWPPELTSEENIRKLDQDYDKVAMGKTWVWAGTQYANGDWLRPEVDQLFTVHTVTGTDVEIVTNCSKKSGKYTFHQDDLSIKVDSIIDKKCETFKIDSRFLLDINSVINGNVSEDIMTLRLNNDSGTMHFATKSEEEIK
jgi:uncharacterized hydrophobic protein (TIGR00271 family)